MKLFSHGGHVSQPDTLKGPLPSCYRRGCSFISANIIVIYRHLRGIDCAHSARRVERTGISTDLRRSWAQPFTLHEGTQHSLNTGIRISAPFSFLARRRRQY